MTNEIIKCSECERQMEGIRVVDIHTTLEDGTEINETIDDRCSGCRDDYGVIFDALTVAVQTLQNDVEELPSSTERNIQHDVVTPQLPKKVERG